MKNKLNILFLIAFAALSSCTKTTNDNAQACKTIAVSIEPQRAIAEAIAHDDFKIITVLEAGANPETFEPSMALRSAIDKSEAYLTIGAFPYENALSESVGTNMINVAEGIEPIYGTHCHHHHHDIDEHEDECEQEHGADPHVWTSAQNTVIIARNITKALCSLNPEKSDVYETRLDSLTAVIDNLNDQISLKLTAAPTRSFLIWHPSLSYFARDYGLKQIAVGQESKEISPRQLKEIIDHATADSVRVLFYQKEFDSRQAEAICNNTSTRLITIEPLSYDWQTQLLKIADELSK